MATANLRKRKIAVLGSRSVGKSTLVRQYIEDRFTEAYYPTIENSFLKGIKYNNVEYECEIIDTAGEDEYSLLKDKHVIGIHGYVLVYSINSRSSFDMIQILYDKIIEYSGKTEIPCVIVGSKLDLSNNRQVEAAEGEELAKKLKGAFIETSAKENLHVASVFEQCLREIEPASESPSNFRCNIM